MSRVACEGSGSVFDRRLLVVEHDRSQRTHAALLHEDLYLQRLYDERVRPQLYGLAEAGDECLSDPLTDDELKAFERFADEEAIPILLHDLKRARTLVRLLIDEISTLATDWQERVDAVFDAEEWSSYAEENDLLSETS